MRLRTLWLLLTILPLSGLNAHPHMWIDGVIGLQVGRSGIEGVRVTWIFDQFNSADMLNQWRINPRGTITPEQSREIHDTAFAHLRDSNYFVLATQRNRAVALPDAVEFTASLDRGQLVYEFLIPLQMPVRQANELVLAFFDQSYFISFMTAPERDVYTAVGATVELIQVPLRLDTDGWGGVQITSLRTIVR